MIKVVAFLDDVTGPAWSSQVLDPEAAPVRSTRNVVLVGEDDAGDLPHRAIGIAYLRDLDHLERFQRHLTTPTGGPARDHVQVTAELVLRGEEWLSQRWSDGGSRYKHVALARRAAGLTPTEFAERWKAHAGTAGTTPIPDVARGAAYAQNHPVPATGEPTYDAINEVWFDDLDALRTRHRWLTETLGSESEPTDDLFGARTLLLVEEEVLGLPTVS